MDCACEACAELGIASGGAGGVEMVVGTLAQKTSENRGIRGGNWNNTENNLRSSNRNNNTPTNSNNNLGFRVARPVSEPSVQSGGAPQHKLAARMTVSQKRRGDVVAEPCSGTTRVSEVSARKRAAKEDAPRCGE